MEIKTMGRFYRAVEESHINDTLKKMQELIYDSDGSKVAASVKDKDIVIFLGNTRCGKSTLVNYAIGNQLQTVKVKRRQYHLVKADPSSAGPSIGSHSTSETSVPTVWQSSKLSGLAVDAPGFQDNRGEAQDVANAFYIKEMINNARSVKFVLISDVSDILSVNLGLFVNFVDTIYTMLPRGEALFGGMTLVFNKVRDDLTKEEACQILKEEILQNISMKVKNRDLIRYFVDNQSQVFMVKAPTGEDFEESQIFGHLIQVVERNTSRLPRNTLSTVNPGISDKSRAFLLLAHSRFSEWRELDEVLTVSRHEFSNILSDCESIEQLADEAQTQKIKEKLSKLEDKIKSARNSSLSVREAMRELSALLPTVAMLKEGSAIYTKLNFVTFVDKILNIDESNVFRVKLNVILSFISDKVAHCKILIQEKTLEVTRAEAEKRYQQIEDDHKLRMKEMEQRLEELSRSNMAAVQQQAQSGSGDFSLLDFIDHAAKAIVTVVRTFDDRRSPEPAQTTEMPKMYYV